MTPLTFTAFTTSAKCRLKVLSSDVEILIGDNKTSNREKIKYNAIWDTGATNTVISEKIARQLNLMPTGKEQVSTANGITEAYKYIISLVLPNKLLIDDIEVTSGNLGNGIDFLIGMDIISLGDFAITNVDGKTMFSYRYPSCQSIDYCQEANKIKFRQLEKRRKIAENNLKQHGNEKCYCGSGRKYRYCCGKKEMEELKKRLEKDTQPTG